MSILREGAALAASGGIEDCGWVCIGTMVVGLGTCTDISLFDTSYATVAFSRVDLVGLKLHTREKSLAMARQARGKRSPSCSHHRLSIPAGLFSAQLYVLHGILKAEY